MSNRPYNHLFFDLDRTLWDFERNSKEALTEIAIDLRLPERGVRDLPQFIRTYQEVNRKCWDLYRKGEMAKAELRMIRFVKTLEVYGIRDEKLAIEFGDMYVATSPRKTNLVEGTTELLESLSQKEYEMHIITNGFEEVQYIKLDECGIREYFTEIIISEHVGEKKPHPLVFNEAMKRANAEAEESVMIGDDLAVDIIGARSVGMAQIYYNPEEIPHEEEISFEIKKLKEMSSILL